MKYNSAYIKLILPPKLDHKFRINTQKNGTKKVKKYQNQKAKNLRKTPMEKSGEKTLRQRSSTKRQLAKNLDKKEEI